MQKLNKESNSNSMKCEIFQALSFSFSSLQYNAQHVVCEWQVWRNLGQCIAENQASYYKPSTCQEKKSLFFCTLLSSTFAGVV